VEIEENKIPFATEGRRIETEISPYKETESSFDSNHSVIIKRFLLTNES
jgi:hypothetical protein